MADVSLLSMSELNRYLCYIDIMPISSEYKSILNEWMIQWRVFQRETPCTATRGPLYYPLNQSLNGAIRWSKVW